MGAATVVTLAIVFLIVAVLAAYLITIAYTLYRVSFNLGTVLIGVRAIVAQVAPVPKYVGIILNDVMAIDQAAQQLLSWGKGPEALETASRVSTMRTSV
ncbi:MAG: hypothetical protein M3179_13665 [Actinomycetota bacterium]|nr:hypothetical protein [Actinomycetota bacterium]